MRATRRGGRVVVSFTVAEAAKLGISTNTTVSAPDPLPEVPVVQSPDPRFECVTPGCYKLNHSFSQTGAFGNGVKEGHFTLNPTHTPKAI